MPTTVIYASTGFSADYSSTSATWSAARTGSGVVATGSGGTSRVGLTGTYNAYQATLGFDCSAVYGYTISSASVSLKASAADSSNNQIRFGKHPNNTSPAAGDWVYNAGGWPVTSLGGAPLYNWSAGNRATISLSSLNGMVNGNTKFMVWNQVIESASDPGSTTQVLTFYQPEQTGTTDDPYLTVNYSLPTSLYAQVFASDGTTALTDEVSVNDGSGSFVGSGIMDLKFTPVANKTKTDWDGARLKLRWDSGSTQIIRVREVSLDYVYEVGQQYGSATLKVKDLSHHAWEDPLLTRVYCPVHHTWEAPLSVWTKYGGTWIQVG